MRFADAIQDLLCHSSMSLAPGPHGNPSVQCLECQAYPIPDIYDYIHHLSQLNILGGCEMAQLYAEWSGDDKIPVSMVIMGIEGILPKRIEGQTLARIVNSVKILKALNAPFTEGATVEPFTEEMNQFLTDCANVIASNREGALDKSEQTVLDNILKSVHTVMSTQDFQGKKFDYYFETLVPYVKTCDENQWTQLPPDDDDDNAINQLIKQLRRSQAIRKHFGKFSISFEMFHVLAGCYASCSDMEVVSNWFLDLAARLCSGDFFWKRYQDCKYVQHVLHIIEMEMKSRRNMDMYYMLKCMKQGEGIESLSENFGKYAQLEKYIKDKIHAPNEMVSHQLFPAAVFENHRDCMAFNVALGFIVNNLDQRTGMVQKGSFRRARQLSRVIGKLMKQMEEFNAEKAIPWTLETMKLFLASDATIDKSIQMLAECIFDKDVEEINK